MKRLLIMVAAATFALAMAGCGSNVTTTDDDASVGAGNDAAVEETDDSDSNEDSEAAETAWSGSDDAAAAAENAGLTDGFTLPDPLPVGDYTWSEPIFSSMDNVAEASYDGGVVGLVVRKGEGVPLEELSSDLNEYGFEWTQDCNGIEVQCHGYEDGVANFIEWENDGSSYNIWCMGTRGGNVGMNSDEVAAMVAGVK